VRLDGIPLAIELAAARVKGLGVEQIVARLDDRFRLLTGGSRTALPRQRTLQATIDWSYKLLSEEECALMRRLSVFAGGWTIEAAEGVCASEELESNQILDTLLRLVDKSLVLAETQEMVPRYQMLETIRQYAQEKLDEAGESNLTRDRHLEYFRALAEQARPHLRSSQQLVWLDRLETEHDNIRAALAWAQDSNTVTTGLYLATNLEMFWIYRAYLHEACLALENLLAASHSTDPIQALSRGHLVAGLLQMFLGNLGAGHAHAKECELLCLQLGPTSKADLADARNLIIYTDVNFTNDPIRSRQAHEQNLKLFLEAGDRWMIAHTIFNIGQTLQRSGDLSGARQAYDQSLVLFQECGDNIRVGAQKANLAFVAIDEGMYAEAGKRLEEALSFYRQARYNLEIDVLLCMLGAIAIREGDYMRAQAWYTECLLFDQRIGKYLQLAECLIGFAGIANAEKRFERAAQLVGAAEAQVKARQLPLENVDGAELRRITTLLREELGDAKFEMLTTEGRALAPEQAIAFALENSDD
jgi:non-specific serine/threonine protein kinase